VSAQRNARKFCRRDLQQLQPIKLRMSARRFRSKGTSSNNANGLALGLDTA
jgi:hypothetical protein